VGSEGIRAVGGTDGDHHKDDRHPIGRLMKDALRFGNGAAQPDDLNPLAVTQE
jgi:hypothetical protein